MSKMNAAMYSEFGDPAKVIKTTEADRPRPGANQVLIKMKMSPIHNHDLLMIRGEYGVKPELPAIGGSEGVGVVEALGDNVEGIAVGTRVSVAGAEQTWAEYFVAAADAVVPVPESMEDAVAAQIMGMPRDAVLALNEFDVAPGGWLVVNAGNGAIGKVVAAVGHSRGLRIAQLVRSESAKDDLLELGFKDVFVTGTDDWKETVRKAVGDSRVAGGVDMVGGEAASDIASLVSEHGLLLSFGAMSNKPLQLSVSDLIFKQMIVRGFWSYKQYQAITPTQAKAIVEELFRLSADGELKLPVEKIVPLADAASAMAASEQASSGKVLISA